MPDASQLSSLPLRDPFTFQFFGASPLFDVRESAGSALGCLVALDTRVKTAAAAYEMEVMLESLAEHVMDLLAQDENILRIYASGDFKFFAASSETFAASRSESSTCLHPSQSSYFALRNEFDIRKASIKTNVAA
ncbi:hypothetical protein F442_02054 [Plasmopara halstedii]|uniref:Uncharacterized protein n=1 Tax=Plasmopara halstedii TaxID=4781 RepID=A0A0P1AHU0_PLAHL|nr:hypothetical protein F442_02054 [Plasmopara halstedii]CEG40708.1 hypothetical protein F442_02054 [Plasmopara halstedii]|eukprot:XP_024577077.1 hypothetical protein F442_02054 [Plasmopara halstedii]